MEIQKGTLGELHTRESHHLSFLSGVSYALTHTNIHSYIHTYTQGYIHTERVDPHCSWLSFLQIYLLAKIYLQPQGGREAGQGGEKKVAAMPEDVESEERF